MKNQTIDILPREQGALVVLIETFRHALHYGRQPTFSVGDLEFFIAEFCKLLALLDAPTKDPCVQAIEHLERFKEVARSGDVGGVIEMGAELIGMAYFDNQEAAENVESTDTALHGGNGPSNSDDDCLREHSVAAQTKCEPVAWTEVDVLDFMSVALRHAEYSGVSPSDILDGLRYMAEKGKPAAYARPDSGLKPHLKEPSHDHQPND